MTDFARRSVVAAGLMALGLAACSNTEGPVSASTSAGSGGKADLTARSEAALNELYAKQPANPEAGRAGQGHPGVSRVS